MQIGLASGEPWESRLFYLLVNAMNPLGGLRTETASPFQVLKLVSPPLPVSGESALASLTEAGGRIASPPPPCPHTETALPARGLFVCSAQLPPEREEAGKEGPGLHLGVPSPPPEIGSGSMKYLKAQIEILLAPGLGEPNSPAPEHQYLFAGVI